MLRFLKSTRLASVSVGQRQVGHAPQYQLYANLDSPDSPLRQKAAPVPLPLSADDIAICNRLKEIHSKEDACVGFAAPQFGILKRIIIVGITQDIADSAPDCHGPFPLTALINPIIKPIPRFGTQTDWETCFSDRYYTGLVERAQVVSYRGVNEHGKSVEGVARGLLARILQHEGDHLDGIMFKDRAMDYRLLRDVYGIAELPRTVTDYAADAPPPPKRRYFSFR